MRLTAQLGWIFLFSLAHIHKNKSVALPYSSLKECGIRANTCSFFFLGQYFLTPFLDFHFINAFFLPFSIKALFEI